MSNPINLGSRRPPVVYTVRVVQHWDGTLEYRVEDVADDERSRNAVLDALQRIGGFQEAADHLHAELLRQIDGLMSAKAGTWEAEKLSQLADIVEAYEKVRFPA